MNHPPLYADAAGKVLDIRLVLDTNVAVQIVSPFDFHRALVRNDGNLTAAATQARLAQLRGSVRLALYCHENSITTLAAKDEQHRVLAKEAAMGSVSGVYATVFTYFVRKRLLSRWRLVYDVEQDAGLRGNASDDALLAHSLKATCPLITREGSKKKSLRAKAKAAGARVFTPEEYLAEVGFVGAVREQAAVGFLQRFDENKPDYAIDQLVVERGRTSLSVRRQEEILTETIRGIRSFYAALLLEESPLLQNRPAT